MLSEYSLGKHGVVMRAAFVAGGSGVAACGVALWQDAGLAAVGLPVAALGPIGAAFVDTDPITTPRSQLTRRSRVHAGLGALFIFGFPVAATSAGVDAAHYLPCGQLLAWAVVIPWAGLSWFLAATIRFGRSATAGKPEVRVGWPNRFNMLAYLAWVAAADALTLAAVTGGV